MSTCVEALCGESLMGRRAACAVALIVGIAGGGTPETHPITYPCKNPDLTHVSVDGLPDPCHFEDPGSPAQAVTNFFNTVAASFCEALFACCMDQMFLQDFAGGTLDNCKDRWADGTALGSKLLLSLKAALV